MTAQEPLISEPHEFEQAIEAASSGDRELLSGPACALANEIGRKLTGNRGNEANLCGHTNSPVRQVRAFFTTRTITVYQAYPAEIADRALEAGTFVPPFKIGRMTWIKPSFLWMMYRSGWASKHGQGRVLAVQIKREGFEWALAHSSLTSYEQGAQVTRQEWAQRVQGSPVRVQWDPERSILLEPMPWRSIQIGLSGQASSRYTREWITGLTDITATVHKIRNLVAAGEYEAAQALLPAEEPYDLPNHLRCLIGAS